VQPPVYRFIVEGELAPEIAAAFPGFEVSYEQGNTVLRGPVRDSEHLLEVHATLLAHSLLLLGLRRDN
jgi:hypothetical protein